MTGVKAGRGVDPAVLRDAYRTGDKYRDRVALFDYQRPRVAFLEWVLGHVEFAPGARVLDVGCGPGLYLRRLRSRSLHLVPVDQSAGMVIEAGGRGVVADAPRLPFASAIADVVIAAHFLYHVADILRALTEMARILRRGGAILVTTNGRAHHARIAELVAEAGEVERVPKPGERFQLENAGDYLGAVFASVELDVIRSQIVLEDPDPIVRFVASCEEFYAPVVGVSWGTLLERVRAIVQHEIDATGTFEMRTESGVFVCRKA